MDDYYEENKKKLECKIGYLEDKLLRSRNSLERENLQKDLRGLRIQLQRVENERRY